MHDTQSNRIANVLNHFHQDASCCGQAPARLEKILGKLDAEVVDHFSGCGSPIPESIEGCRVVDLGCGTGRDVYLCAALAGPRGYVLGLDNEKESLDIARRHVEATMKRFGHSEPNVVFRKGDIAALADARLADEDFDVVISNRTLNLVEKKLPVLKEVLRVLKPGGEFYFSDIFSDRRLPPELLGEDTLVREQPGGALYIGDFIRKARKAGFRDPRIVANHLLPLEDLGCDAPLGGAQFWAVTFRLFKVAELELGEEDYGQTALYKGTVPGCAQTFTLDATNRFQAGRAVPVGGNTSAILQVSRFAPHFEITGDRSHHFGPFVR